MKKQFIGCLAMLCFSQIALGQEPTHLTPRDLPSMKPDSATTSAPHKVEAKLGSAVWSALLASEEVTAYWLDAQQPDSSKSAIGGYRVLGGGVPISDIQKDTLLHYLQAETSYYFDSFSKSCDYHPNIAFQVGEELLITASLTCDLWQFQLKGTPASPPHDLDKAHEPMLNLALELFPEMGAQSQEEATRNNADSAVIAYLDLELAPRELGNGSTLTEQLPPKIPAVKTHTVLKGENLTKIARKYGVTVKKLMEWNEKTSDLIRVDEELIVKRE